MHDYQKLSLDLGVLGPLLYTVRLYKDVQVRKQACEVLRRHRWRQGIWSAEVLTERLAECHMVGFLEQSCGADHR